MELTTKITEVTVYTNRARVTRRGTAELEKGEYRLQISPLPLCLVPQSVRVAGKGTAEARLLGVDTAREFYTETPATDTAELIERIQELQDRDKVLTDEEATITAQMQLLNTLAEAGGQNLPKGIAFGKANVDDVREMAEYLTAQYATAQEQARDIAIKRRDLHKELKKLQRELEQRKSTRGEERYVAYVDMEILSAGELSLELTYLVNYAYWTPLYDVRLDETAAEHNVEVTYMGQVAQETGEEWERAQLTLSTARPALSTTLPELTPWYLNIYAPPPPPASMGKARRAAAPMAAMMMDVEESIADEFMEFEKAPAEPRKEVAAQAATAQVEQSGAAVTFKVAKPVTIPSDGSPHKTTVAILPLFAKLDYLTVPKMADAVYRRATIENDTEFVFLPGSVNIFHAGEYVGSTELKNIAPNEEFEIMLGADDRVKVKRELVSHEVDKRGFMGMGDKRRLQYEYEIKVHNLRDTEEKIIVWDQIPHSQHEDIKVELETAEPPPVEKTELGILKWELEFAPLEEQEIWFRFTVEHARNKTIVGLPEVE